MADEDPYTSPLKPAVPLPRINQNPNKFYGRFMYKTAIVAVFIVFLPFLPSQAPEFINQTLHTRSWEFLQLLFVGLAVSYGLFSRKNGETEKDHHSSKFDNANTYVSRFLEVSSVFEDEADNSPGTEDSKVQTWNSQYHREKPTVVVAQESSLVDEWRRIRSGPNEKPLLLPVRSLKSRVSGSDFTPEAMEAKELSGSLRRSSSFSTSRRRSNSFDQSLPNSDEKEDENVVLRSPIPWRSRSGRMEMKEEIDGIPSYSLPSPMAAESSFRLFESDSYRPQNSRSPRPNSTPPTPKKVFPSSPSQSPPKLSPPPPPPPQPTPPPPNAAEAARKNIYYKAAPPPPPPPPQPTPLPPNAAEAGRRNVHYKATPPPPPPPPPQPTPPPPNAAQAARRDIYYKATPPQPPQPTPPPPNAAHAVRRDIYYKATPPPPPPPPQPLYARKPPIAKSYSSQPGSSEFSSAAKELKRTTRSIPSYTKEPDLVLERERSGSEESKNDGSLVGKSVRTVRTVVESVGSVPRYPNQPEVVLGTVSESKNRVISDGSLAGKSVSKTRGAVESVGSVEASSYPHMSEAAFRGYEKEFAETMSEESTDEREEEDEDVIEEDSNHEEEASDVNQKADEFIAKFREQIRLQRIESIKRSTAQIARNSSR